MDWTNIEIYLVYTIQLTRAWLPNTTTHLYPHTIKMSHTDISCTHILHAFDASQLAPSYDLFDVMT